MCVVIDLDAVCLICLQPSKEMQSVFTTDVNNSELQIAQKISILSELKIDKSKHSLPSKICAKCLEDLKAAWRFRKNCQAAVTIFQTIVNLDVCQPEANNATTKEIKVPQGLQIKRVEVVKEANAENSSDAMPTHKKAQLDEYVIVAEKDNSTLYEELGTNEYVCEQEEEETNEFQSLEDGEANDTNQAENVEHENPLMEYYFNDDGTAEEISIKVETESASNSKNMETKIHKNEKDSKQTKLAEFLAKINKPIQRGRPRKKARSETDEEQPVNRTQIQNSEKFVVSKIKKEDVIKNTAEYKRKTNQATQIRQVKTRKRKSLTPITKPPKICEICGNSYRFQHALKAHMRRHYNEKPFPCEFCDKAFVSNIELRRHIRVHTGQKPYACQYCERRFSDFGSRIKHERTHTGERPYACGTCGKSFAYPHVLSVHLLTHTGEKRFRCDYCSKGFTKKVYLQGHVEQHHKDADNYENINDDEATNSSQDKCDLSTEYVVQETVEINSDYEDEEDLETGKLIVTSSNVQFKEEDTYVEQANNGSEDNEVDIHEIVEILPDEYTIHVR